MSWGGKREGAGRPKGWRKPFSEARTRRGLVAFDDEWDLIKRFANLVKYSDKEKCAVMLAHLENELKKKFRCGGFFVIMEKIFERKIQMLQAKIIETNLNFNSLSRRDITSRIVIHHTGSVKDVDVSAAQIHEMHKGNGWSGIGYHFVIRKDGTIERGRPVWAVGSHAQGHNSNSIGIHLCGDFNAAFPTEKQIESAALLCANLCAEYNIPIDRNHIMGHEECYSGVGRTKGAGCPGKNLQAQLDTISGKANWYRFNSGADVVDMPTDKKVTCPHCGASFVA